ncbi:MAG TPA: bifunctional 2-polyprenyl-6-hydroxyphenol methylase/3-demethylubiquinol 3-O-methyltransferase UbiG [Steroidobacteraceae bacterium]|jgi:2-polyprenyl-6-hydroxyphenyl methylase/3-demethylubiquinone-9 3-methyltransferase|nr:bifunctional 2-polyprenyl-6-hydroxyphenol methylase/3-demethylubiquinol 3-O-methyltransferase UbiG [Steroidobacteraceae bacterium]
MQAPNPPHPSTNSDAAEIAKFDAAAHRFWDVDGEFKPLHKLNPVRARYVQERASLRGAQLLDVGCGGGLLAEAMARAGAQVTAIDLASSMIETARMHALDAGLQIDYRLESAESLLTAHAGKFDVVTCMEMLEHVPDPGATLAVLGKLTRPGGHVFISTINRNLKSFALAIVGAEYLARLVPRGTHEYERLLKPSEVARFARAAGLQVSDIAGLRYDPLREQCSLTRDPSVNYLMHMTRGTAPEPQHE